jgi:hypothetical protein
MQWRHTFISWLDGWVDAKKPLLFNFPAQRATPLLYHSHALMPFAKDSKSGME